MCPTTEALGSLGTLGKTFPSTVVGSGEYLLPTSTITPDNDESQGPACWPPLHPSSLQPPDPGLHVGLRPRILTIQQVWLRLNPQGKPQTPLGGCSPSLSPTSMPQTPGSPTAPSRAGGLPSTKVGLPFSQTQVPTALLSAEGQQGPRTKVPSPQPKAGAAHQKLWPGHTASSKAANRPALYKYRGGWGFSHGDGAP